MERQHLRPLTSLRFFAAAAIVVHHMQKVLDWDTPGVLTQGVGFFFVLSGFILTYVYGRSFDIRRFYVSRFARLWPVHAFCFFLVIALINVPTMRFQDWPLIAASNLTMTHAWFPVIGVPFSFNGPSWSISTEFAFYLCFPLLVGSRHFWVAYGVVVLVTAGTLLLAASVPPSPPSAFQLWPVHIVLQHPAVRLLEFATGVAAGRMFASMSRPSINPTALEIGVIAVLVLYWVYIYEMATMVPGRIPRIWVRESSGLVLFAGAIMIFGWGAGAVSRLLSTRLMVKLGEISFATYMLHQIVIRWFASLKVELDWYYSAALILVLAYGGSWLIHDWIETPMRRFIIGLSGPGPGRGSRPRDTDTALRSSKTEDGFASPAEVSGTARQGAGGS